MLQQIIITFQSTLSVRRATILKMWIMIVAVRFQSTLSVRRATLGNGLHAWGYNISIHALREESDSKFMRLIKTILHFNPRSPWGERPFLQFHLHGCLPFQSTLSVRRATTSVYLSFTLLSISIHALREESDSAPIIDVNVVARISIHALREESDPKRAKQFMLIFLFQSTLSVRRATSP